MSVNVVNQNGSLTKIAGGLPTSDINVVKGDLSVVETTNIASRAYSQGDCFIMSTGQLVRATSAIAQGATIALGTNVSAISVIDLLAEKVNTSSLGTAAYKNIGTANGVAELDANGQVLSSQLPSYVDDVIEGYYKEADGKFYKESTYVTKITPEASKIYVDLGHDVTYRWSGSAYVAIGSSLALGETSSTAYRGDRGKTAYDHASDSNKISTAQTLGMYKIAVTAEGHISAVEAVDASSGSAPPEVVNMNVTQVNGISFGIEE